jgi:hypothetical protein
VKYGIFMVEKLGTVAPWALALVTTAWCHNPEDYSLNIEWLIWLIF